MILFVFNDKLFAGIYNAVEGASIWVSGDGVKFNQVVSKGLGDKDNIGIGTPIIFRDKLLVPVQNGYVSSIKDGAEIWSSEDGLTFKRIITRGLGEPSNILLRFLPISFKDYIYVGTYNPVKGGEIWRSRDGVEWEKMIEGGVGDTGNTILDPQVVFKDKIYVLTYNLNGLSVFRSEDGENWEKVVENGFNYGSYRNVYGLLTVIDENLYLTTFSTPGVGAFQIWKTSDGEN